MPYLAIGIPMGWEWVLIFAVILLIFGGSKLPGLARSMGSSITQFKRGLKDDPDTPRLDEESTTEKENKDAS